MAKKSTPKPPAEPDAGKSETADLKAESPAGAEIVESPATGTPKTEVEQTAKPAPEAEAKASTAFDGKTTTPPKPDGRGDTNAPAGSEKRPEIPISAALMAAAIANRRRLAKWLNGRAATVAIAAGLGAVVGSVVSSGLGQAITLVANHGAADSERALHASIGQLTSEVASLKAQIARADKASAIVLSGTPQLLGGAEVADASGRAEPENDPALVSPEITGSIEVRSPPVAKGWTLWRVRNGRALVQGSSGYFEVAPGSRLPGLGLVERIIRHGDGWAVETRSGLILPQG